MNLDCTIRRFGSLLALALLAAVTGCKAPAPKGTIPFGTWAGNGLYVYAGWDTDEARAEGRMATLLRGKYPTTLTIGPSTVEGRDVVLIEIESNRGELPGLGDKTQARIALEEVTRFGDATVIYRLVAASLNEPMDKPLELESTSPPASAVCTVDGDNTLLQIQYGDNFVDTYEFSDEEVEKAGMFFNDKKAIIQWWEELEKRRR